MCLSSVYQLRQGKKELVQSEVAHMEQQGDGYVLYDILGKRSSVKGRILSVDFLDTNMVVIQDTSEEEMRETEQ